MTLTPLEAAALLDRFDEFREGRLTIEELQSAVGVAAVGTQSIEQNKLRDLLDWAEGNLDSIRFTHPPEKRQAAAIAIVDRVAPALRRVVVA